MEYQVPQFIEVEDKIVGTLTLKQFIYIAGGAGICIVFFTYFPIIVALLLSAPIVGFTVALSFYKVNGKPFIEVLEAAFNYYTRAKLFLWQHKDVTIEERRSAANEAAVSAAAAAAPRGGERLTRGKLSELAWSLDINNQSPGTSR